MKEISLGLLIPNHISSSEIMKIMKIYFHYFPDHIPDTISYAWNKKESFSMKEEQIEKFWKISDIYLKNKNFKLEILVSRPGLDNDEIIGPSKHSGLNFEIKTKKIDTVYYQKMIIELSKKSGTEFGHFQIPPKKKERQESENRIYQYGLFLVASVHIQNMIPEVFMGNVYGKRYASHFGMKKLLSIPAPVVKQISEDQVYFQAVEDFDKFKPEELSENRKKIKEYLGINNFYQDEKGPEYPYDHPDFGPKWEPVGVHNMFIA